ncbi:MAG: hypothetical protein AB1626_01065, partial [Candidatus Micrarchaeota archaeon]
AIFEDEEKGPAFLAEVKRRYYQPLDVHKAIDEANTILTGLTFRQVRQKRLSAEHHAALAALPPFSRRFLATWLAGHEALPKGGLFALSPEEREKLGHVSELRLDKIKKVIAEGPAALRKLVDGLVLGERSRYRAALRPEEREYDQVLLRADRAHHFDAVRRLYLGYEGKRK